MATCKACIHFAVCDSGRHIGEYIEDDGVYSEGVEKGCEFFLELPCGVTYGETPIYYAKDGKVIEYVCVGYAEHLVWSHRDMECSLACFIYGRNAGIASSCFLVAEHGAFLHTPTVGREVFFNKKEALAVAEAQRKEQEGSEKYLRSD